MTIIISLLLIMATIAYCLYHDSFKHSEKINQLMMEYDIKRLLGKVFCNQEEALPIKQMYKDYEAVSPIDGIDLPFLLYLFTALISLVSLFIQCIGTYKTSAKTTADIMVFVISLAIPVIICAVIWICISKIDHKDEEYEFSTIPSMQRNLSDEKPNYHEITALMETVFMTELKLKAKMNRRYGLIEAFLLASILIHAMSYINL